MSNSYIDIVMGAFKHSRYKPEYYLDRYCEILNIEHLRKHPKQRRRLRRVK